MTVTERLEETQIATSAPLIQLTITAASKIQSMLDDNKLEGHGLRVFVAGGGCSGVQYGLGIAAGTREFDTVIESYGVKVFVDPTSLMYLEGSVIDFDDSPMGGGFRVDNPQPQTAASCDCGHSYQAQSSAAPAGGCGSGCACV